MLLSSLLSSAPSWPVLWVSYLFRALESRISCALRTENHAVSNPAPSEDTERRNTGDASVRPPARPPAQEEGRPQRLAADASDTLGRAHRSRASSSSLEPVHLAPEPRGSCRPPPGHPRPSATGPHGNRGPSVTPRVHLLSGPRCPPLSDHELLFVERKEALETGEWAPRSLGRCPAAVAVTTSPYSPETPAPSRLRPGFPSPSGGLSKGRGFLLFPDRLLSFPPPGFASVFGVLPQGPPEL